jgi:hypothetical protein
MFKRGDFGSGNPALKIIGSFTNKVVMEMFFEEPPHYILRRELAAQVTACKCD